MGPYQDSSKPIPAVKLPKKPLISKGFLALRSSAGKGGAHVRALACTLQVTYIPVDARLRARVGGQPARPICMHCVLACHHGGSTGRRSRADGRRFNVR